MLGAGVPVMGSKPVTYVNGFDEYLVHVNYGESLSIDFQQCENYKAQLEHEQKEKIERMKRRYNAIQTLPAYIQNPKESLALKLATDEHYREQLGHKIGGKEAGEPIQES